MKKDANQSLVMLASALFAGGRIWDESAETVKEIASKTGLSQSHTRQRVLDFVAAGRLERVWKRVAGHPVPAYRILK